MRTEEAQKTISLGDLWSQFKETLFYSELKKMMDEKTEELKQEIVDKTISKNYEEAQVSAWVLKGLNILDEFLDAHISAAHELILEEKEQKTYESHIKKHVR